MEGHQEEEKETEGRKEPEEEIKGDEGSEISMHALQGHASGKVLKVRGIVRKRSLVVLIDSGSTHNFLDKEI